MNNKNIFVIILVITLTMIILPGCSEKFSNDDADFNQSSNPNTNTGLYNHFFMEYLNPYPLPLKKFFQNDVEKSLE